MTFTYTVRGAIRGLLRAPAFSVTTVLILAIGLAGAVVMITLVYGVLLRPLPVRDQGRLIVAWKDLPSSGFAHLPFGDTEIVAVANASHLVEAVAGVSRHGASETTIVEGGAAYYLNEAFVTGGAFEVLGVQPHLGRTLTRADDRTGAEQVVVISHRLWQKRYAASPQVLGRRLGPFVVVGVMPPDFDYPGGADFWRTPASASGVWADAVRREVDLIGRIRPGVSIEQVTSELLALTRTLEAAAPAEATRGLVPVVQRFERVVAGDVGPVLALLLAAVMLVLAIAIANAANLLSMRNESRRAELAVRMALGAGRGKIAVQLITESLLLALVAGAVGLALAWWSLQILLAVGPTRLPRVDSVRIDALVMLSALVVAITTALGVAMAPVWVLHGNLVTYLKSGGRGAPGAASRRLRQSFVVGQVALAITLLAAAGLLTHSVFKLQAIETGLPTGRLMFVELSLPAQQTERAWKAAFFERLMTELRSVPFLAAATPVNGLPYPGISGWDVPQFTAEGQRAEEAASNPSLNLESIFPNYFATLEVPIAKGRPFAEADREGTAQVAIVSEDVALRIWPDGDAIGRRLKMGGPTSRESWLTVVGVAKPVRVRELTQVRPTLYLPAAQFLMTAQNIAVRTAAQPDQVASAFRERLRVVEPATHVMRVVTFDEVLAQPLARPRFNAFVLGLFAAVAVLLATVGLYAVMRTYVRQRDRDIAVRRALGASAGDVQRLVVGEALRLVCVGVVVGLAGAVGAARVVRGLLYGITPLDPVALVGAALMLTVVSLFAAYLPARHAARVDPLVALRHD